MYSFLCGPAGTGKTTIVSRAAEESCGGVVLCATTGIAAVNLGPGVTTINSLLRYFDTPSLRTSWTSGQLDARLWKLVHAGVEEICLDEVSMMDGDQLAILVEALDGVNGRLMQQGRAPLRLRLVGDMAQLQPVKAKFVFEVPAWTEFERNTTVLTKMWRQDNPEFLAALRAARQGNGEAAAEYLRQFARPSLDHHWPGTTLLAKNTMVDRFNTIRYREIPGAETTFPSRLWGKARPEWQEVSAPVRFKVGALVMVLANKRKDADTAEQEMSATGVAGETFEYVNGDVGVIEEIDTSKHGSAEWPIPWVRLHRRSKVVPIGYVTRQHLIPLEAGRRKVLKEEGHAERAQDKWEVVGELTYMPLRLAWATTVHKAQGLTLEKVQVAFNDPFFQKPGMAYVAVSRLRSPEGLALVGNPEMLKFKFAVDPRVRRWL